MKRKNLISTLVLTLSLTIISPFITKAHAVEKLQAPSIKGTSAISIDYETGEIIYAKDIDAKAYPASTTKLMTALLFAENKSKNDDIKYTEDAKAQPAYSLNTNFQPIPIGETMTAEDVMNALLLYSANDSAYMVADAVGGTSDNFIKMMNDKAKELNLKNTNFVTPNGVDDGPNGDSHYTTAFDLATIGKAAYHNDWVKEVMGTKEATITINKTAEFKVDNRNENLGLDGCIGGKTGFTTKAGRCLVALYERDGRKIVGVVLNSGKDINNPQVFKDMESLINYSYAAEKTSYISSGTEVAKVNVDYKAFKFFGPKKTVEASVLVDKDITIYDNDINKNEGTVDVDVQGKDAWSLAAKPETEVNFSIRDYNQKYVGKINISTFTLIKTNIVTYLITLGVLIVVFALIYLLLTAKSRRRKRRYF